VQDLRGDSGEEVVVDLAAVIGVQRLDLDAGGAHRGHGGPLDHLADIHARGDDLLPRVQSGPDRVLADPLTGRDAGADGMGPDPQRELRHVGEDVGCARLDRHDRGGYTSPGERKRLRCPE